MPTLQKNTSEQVEWSDDHRENLARAKKHACDLYKEGRSVRAVAKITGTEEKILEEWFFAAEIMRPAAHQRDAENKGMSAMHERKVPLTEIAREFGISANTVRNRLTKCGYKPGPSPRERAAAIDTEELRRAKEAENLSIAQVATRFGIGTTTAWRRLNGRKRKR